MIIVATHTGAAHIERLEAMGLRAGHYPARDATAAWPPDVDLTDRFGVNVPL